MRMRKTALFRCLVSKTYLICHQRFSPASQPPPFSKPFTVSYQPGHQHVVLTVQTTPVSFEEDDACRARAFAKCDRHCLSPALDPADCSVCLAGCGVTLQLPSGCGVTLQLPSKVNCARHLQEMLQDCEGEASKFNHLRREAVWVYVNEKCDDSSMALSSFDRVFSTEP
jgi:hypothetical protein